MQTSCERPYQAMLATARALRSLTEQATEWHVRRLAEELARTVLDLDTRMRAGLAPPQVWQPLLAAAQQHARHVPTETTTTPSAWGHAGEHTANSTHPSAPDEVSSEHTDPTASDAHCPPRRHADTARKERCGKPTSDTGDAHTLFALGRGEHAERLGGFHTVLMPGDLVRLPIGRELLTATTPSAARDCFARFALVWDVAGLAMFARSCGNVPIPEATASPSERKSCRPRCEIYTFDDGQWYRWPATGRAQWHHLMLTSDGILTEYRMP